MTLVGVVMGSRSDEPVAKETTQVLDSLGIAHEVQVLSAHRTPEKAMAYAQSARERGLEVLIALAGGAAALPGVLASWTTLPVIGVPLASSELKGVDALYAIVQMPPGVPVATVSIGAWGGINAAVLAARILAVGDPDLREKVKKYMAAQADKIAKKDEKARRSFNA